MENLIVPDRQIAKIQQIGAGMSHLKDKRRALLREFYTLPGRGILNRVLDVDEPHERIQGIFL